MQHYATQNCIRPSVINSSFYMWLSQKNHILPFGPQRHKSETPGHQELEKYFPSKSHVNFSRVWLVQQQQWGKLAYILISGRNAPNLPQTWAKQTKINKTWLKYRKGCYSKRLFCIAAHWKRKDGILMVLCFARFSKGSCSMYFACFFPFLMDNIFLFSFFFFF